MSLAEYYKINWHMSFNYKYTLSDLEKMVPYERDFFVSMTADEIEKRIEMAKSNG